MAKTLSIYACSGIGANSNVPESGYNYWLDNTETVSNTQAVNSLLAHINMLAVECLYLDLDDEQLLQNLNDIDFYSTVLYFVKQYQDRPDDLLNVGRAIGKAYDNDLFSFVEFDNKLRDLHLDEVIGKVAEYMDDADLGDPSDGWSKWWNDNVSALNTVWLNPDQQLQVKEALGASKISGIGALDWSNNKELANYINNAGEYFLYTYATDDQLAQLPSVMRQKAKVQKQVYEYCKSMFVGVYGTERAYKELLYTSIIHQIGKEPEQAIAEIVEVNNAGSGKISGIVEVITAVVELLSIILSLLGVVASIVVAICDAVKAKEVSQQKKIDQETVMANQASDEDFKTMSALAANNKKLEKRNKLIWFAVAALGLMLLKK